MAIAGFDPELAEALKASLGGRRIISN